MDSRRWNKISNSFKKRIREFVKTAPIPEAIFLDNYRVSGKICGSLFFAIRTDWFSCWELISAIFNKYHGFAAFRSSRFVSLSHFTLTQKYRLLAV